MRSTSVKYGPYTVIGSLPVNTDLIGIEAKKQASKCAFALYDRKVIKTV